MDSSAVLWILAWSGVISIGIVVLTGILKQLLPLVEAWHSLLDTFRGDRAQDAVGGSEPAPKPKSAEEPTAAIVPLEAAGSAAALERHDEKTDSVMPAPAPHQ
ncbi:hypothetical protein ACFVIM_05345 [Streptomyces sp. NPDC057638]|uniref:hypothetical protein n=1 Tax=Streptomyces sp. NPDC057638 TaxID=3346190 RepID=UPI00367EF863